MHKIATKIFIGASLVFALFGTLLIVTEPRGSAEGELLTKGFMISILIILSSFAVIVANLSVYAVHVAYKYLHEGK
jgi:hypothetical protein